MKRFVLTGQAEHDLGQIKSYLAGRAGPTMARRVMRDIRGAIAFVAREPLAGHKRDDLTSRALRFWPVYSFLIVYDPEARPIQVVRVIHGMRDVGRLLA